MNHFGRHLDYRIGNTDGCQVGIATRSYKSINVRQSGAMENQVEAVSQPRKN